MNPDAHSRSPPAVNPGGAVENRPRDSSPSFWKVFDTPAAPGAPANRSQLPEPELLDRLLEGAYSLNVQVAPPGGTKWVLPEVTAALAPACVGIRFAREGKWEDELTGMVVIASNRARLLDLAQRVRSSEVFKKLAFFLPILNRDRGGTIVKQTRLFQLWPSTYFGCVLESHYVMPGQPLNAFLIGMNLTEKPQTHTLVPAGVGWPDALRNELAFALPPHRWQVHHFWLGSYPDTKPHHLEFQTTSAGERIGTSVAVAVASLGMVRYRPGTKGFAIGFATLETNQAKLLSTLGETAVEALDELFESQKADGFVGPDGTRTPREQVVAWCKYYIQSKPEQLMDALREAKAPAEAMQAVIERFIHEQFPLGTTFSKPGESTPG